MTAHYSAFPRDGQVADIAQAPRAAEGPRVGLYRNAFKRLLDMILVIAFLPVVLPVTLILMLLVARDGYNPIYRQKRVGRDGRIFTIWKLRTMVPDADMAMERHLAENEAARREWSETQKLKCDPRITRTGRILRKTSFDELPQLWNVLKGDMSLVGPRPMMPCQEALYPGRVYYILRPGITGLWQISDRNETSFAARATFDAIYDRKLSLLTDLKILFATIGVVLRGTGY